MARIDNTTATNIFFTEISLADNLPVLIVYAECYGRLNRLRDGRFLPARKAPVQESVVGCLGFQLQLRFPFSGHGRGRRQGQGEVEDGAFAEFAFGPDASAVGQDDVLDDGQAEAGAAGLAGTGFVDAVEALKDAIEVFGGDAGAEVLDGEFDFALEQARADANPAAGFAVLDSVFDEVAEDLVHGVGIGQDRRVRRAGRLEFDSGIEHHAAQRLDGI